MKSVPATSMPLRLLLLLVLVALVVKNPPANAGDTRDVGSVPGLGRSTGEGHGNHSRIPVWRIPWTEEPGRLHPGVPESDMTER